MGFFEKLTKLSPEAQRLAELKTQKITQEADAIREQARAMRDRQIAEIQAEGDARVAPIEQRIAEQKREMLDLGRKTMLGLMCMSLAMDLSSSLTRSLSREQITDMKATREAVRKEVGEKVEAFKGSVSRDTLTDLENWALGRVVGDEQSTERVKKAAADFIQKLQRDGIALE